MRRRKGDIRLRLSADGWLFSSELDSGLDLTSLELVVLLMSSLDKAYREDERRRSGGEEGSATQHKRQIFFPCATWLTRSPPKLELEAFCLAIHRTRYVSRKATLKTVRRSFFDSQLYQSTTASTQLDGGRTPTSGAPSFGQACP